MPNLGQLLLLVNFLGGGLGIIDFAPFDELCLFLIVLLLLLAELLLHQSLMLITLLVQLPDFVLQVLNLALLLLTHHHQTLDVVVGLPKFCLQVSHLHFHLVHLHELRINILSWQIRNHAGSSSVVERADVFFQVAIRGRKASHHQRV